MWADFYLSGAVRLESVGLTRFVMPGFWRIDFVDDSYLVWTSESEEMGSDRPIRYRRTTAFVPTTA